MRGSFKLEQGEEQVNHFVSLPRHVKGLQVDIAVEREAVRYVGHRNHVVLLARDTDRLDAAIHLLLVKILLVVELSGVLKDVYNFIGNHRGYEHTKHC